MRNITICLFVLMLFSAAVLAQSVSDIETVSLKTSKGEVPAFKIKIAEADLNTVSKLWTRELTRNNKSKLVKSGNEFSIENIVLSRVSTDTINVYSTLNKASYGVDLIAAFELKGVFINEFNTREVMVNGIKSFLQEFARQQLKVAVNDELAREERILKSLNNRLNTQINQNTNLRKRVATSEQRIAGLEDEIGLENSMREQKNKEIAAQRAVLNDLRDNPEVMKSEQDKLKKLESERKAIQRKIESANQKIVSLRSEIQKANRDIAVNEEQQNISNKEIKAQMAKISEIETRLRGMK